VKDLLIMKLHLKTTKPTKELKEAFAVGNEEKNPRACSSIEERLTCNQEAEGANPFKSIAGWRSLESSLGS
jgi:hypothetical protein